MGTHVWSRWKERAVDVFDDDAEPFDLKDDADNDEDDYDDGGVPEEI